MKQVDHIGIAVHSFKEAVPIYEKLLNTPCYKFEEVESEQVNTAFFKTGQEKIELLEASSSDSVIKKYIEKRGEGIHHIAFLVEDIHAEMERLKRDGFTLINEVPKKGADNKWVCFLHPRNTYGVLIELCQEI